MKTIIREKYGEAARRAGTGGRSSCCGGSPCGADNKDPITSDLYSEADAAALPEQALGVTEYGAGAALTMRWQNSSSRSSASASEMRATQCISS